MSYNVDFATFSLSHIYHIECIYDRSECIELSPLPVEVLLCVAVWLGHLEDAQRQQEGVARHEEDHDEHLFGKMQCVIFSVILLRDQS